MKVLELPVAGPRVVPGHISTALPAWAPRGGVAELGLESDGLCSCVELPDLPAGDPGQCPECARLHPASIRIPWRRDDWAGARP